VRYAIGEPDIVIVPLSAGPEDEVNRIIGNDNGLIMAKVTGTLSGLIYDCTYHPEFEEALLRCISGRSKMIGENGIILGSAKADFKAMWRNVSEWPVMFSLLRAGSHITYFSCASKSGKSWLFKLFRRLEEGTNPDIELHRKLTPQEECKEIIAEFCGMLEYQRQEGSVYEVGLLTSFVHKTGTAWNQAVDHAGKFLEEALTLKVDGRPDPASVTPLLDVQRKPGVDEEKLFGPFVKMARALSHVTACMHRTLAGLKDEDCCPEAFTALYQRSMYQTSRTLTRQTFALLRRPGKPPSEEERRLIESLLEKENDIITGFTRIYAAKLSGFRFRIHGNFHLGRLFAVDSGFVIRDFEGNSEIAFSERRLKRSPLRDVASMINSIYWTAQYALQRQVAVQKKERQFLDPWADAWSSAMGNLYLSGYLTEMEGTGLLPTTPFEIMLLIKLFLISRALGEINVRFRESGKDRLIPLIVLHKFLALLR
jgi:maltose alpha-D-glucosyltransferase/alpha-amylase